MLKPLSSIFNIQSCITFWNIFFKSLSGFWDWHFNWGDVDFNVILSDFHCRYREPTGGSGFNHTDDMEKYLMYKLEKTSF